METVTRHRRKWAETPSARQQDVLDALGVLGEQRRELADRKAYTTRSGRIALDKIYAKLRRTIERGENAGLGGPQMRAQLGITSTAYYKIKSGRTGSA